MVAVTASWGLGLAVVGGEVTPDDFLVSKVTGEVVRERVHVKDVEYVPDAAGRGAVTGAPVRAASRFLRLQRNCSYVPGYTSTVRCPTSTSQIGGLRVLIESRKSW